MKARQSAIGVFLVLLAPWFMGVSAAELRESITASVAPTDPGLLPDLLRTDTQESEELASQAPAWQQVNEDGFGDPDAGEVNALASFNGSLYAGTSNAIDGARIFRSQDGATWTPVTDPGFGIAHDIRPPAILDLTVFNGRLYASTGRGDGPAQIWRTVNGVNWAPMTITGFSNPDTVDITALAEFDNFFYAGATNLITGAEIWRSFTGDNNTWTKVAPTVPTPGVACVTGMAVFDGALYAALESEWTAQIWRTYGGAWTPVMTGGFGNPSTSTGGMAEFASYLYVGAGNEMYGAQLWRTGDGTSWQQVIDPGFGDPNNLKVEAAFVFQNLLYVSVKNTQTGIELWRSADGMTWDQVNPDGFGDSDNSSSNWSNAVAEFLGDLYIGTVNIVDGGELWRMQVQPPPPPPSPTPSPTPSPAPLNQHSYIPVIQR